MGRPRLVDRGWLRVKRKVGEAEKWQAKVLEAVGSVADKRVHG